MSLKHGRISTRYEKNKYIYDIAGPEESGAVIEHERGSNTYVLFEIPQYGGEPMHDSDCSSLSEAIAKVESWT